MLFEKIFGGRSLHRFFARLSTLGSSSGSERLHGFDNLNTEMSNSTSIVPCSATTSSQSRGQSLCNLPRQRMQDRQNKKRKRSNPAVVLLNSGDPVVLVDVVVEKDAVEVIALSSGGLDPSIPG